MWGGSPDRNMVSDETGVPSRMGCENEEKHQVDSHRLGSQTYGNPVIARRKNFHRHQQPRHIIEREFEGDKGVVLCLEEKTGKLSMASHP